MIFITKDDAIMSYFFFFFFFFFFFNTEYDDGNVHIYIFYVKESKKGNIKDIK